MSLGDLLDDPFLQQIGRPDDAVRRPYATFSIPSDLSAVDADGSDRSLIRAADLEAARRIATELERRGYDVSKVRPGSGGAAGFSCRLNRDCEIGVLLGVERRERGAIDFYLMTWQTASLGWQILRGGVKKAAPDCDRRWNAFCRAMNDILVDTLGAISIIWRTEDEERRDSR